MASLKMHFRECFKSSSKALLSLKSGKRKNKKLSAMNTFLTNIALIT
jgi:hypothetical protein